MTSQKEIERRISKAFKKMNLSNLLGAMRNFIKIVKIDPIIASSYFARGKAKEDLDIFTKVIEDFGEAIEDNLEMGNDNREMGLACLDEHRNKQSIPFFDKAIQINPEDKDAYCYRGIAKCEIGKSKEAILDLTQAIKLNYEENLVYFYRGKSYLDDCKYEEAVNDLDKYIKMESRKFFDSQAYFLRGLAKLGNSDYVGAIPDFTRMLKRAPYQIGYKVFLDYAKFKKKNKNEKFLDNYKLPEMEEKWVKKWIVKHDK